MDAVLLLVVGAVAALVVERGWNWLSPRIVAAIGRTKQEADLESQRRQWRETTLDKHGALMGRRYLYHAPTGGALEAVVVDMGGMYYSEIDLEFVDRARASALSLGTRVRADLHTLDPVYLEEYHRQEEAKQSEQRFTPLP